VNAHHEDAQRTRAHALLNLAIEKLPAGGEATIRLRRDRTGELVVDRPELRATLELYGPQSDHLTP
jgi:hypothetical protein